MFHEGAFSVPRRCFTTLARARRSSTSFSNLLYSLGQFQGMFVFFTGCSLYFRPTTCMDFSSFFFLELCLAHGTVVVAGVGSTVFISAQLPLPPCTALDTVSEKISFYRCRFIFHAARTEHAPLKKTVPASKLLASLVGCNTVVLCGSC